MKASWPENELEQPSTISVSVTPCCAATGAAASSITTASTATIDECMDVLLEGAVTSASARVTPPGMNNMHVIRMAPKTSGR